MKNNNIFLLLAILLLLIALIAAIFYLRNQQTILTTNSPLLQSNSSPTVTNPAVLQGKININIASAEELSYLPGIGTTLAIRIVQYRIENGSFKTAKDLLKVEGMTKVKYDSLVEYITVN